MVGDDSVIACTSTILLDVNSLLMYSGGVKNEFVDHSYVCRTLSFSSSQLFFSKSVILFGDVVSYFGPIDLEK